LLTDRQTDKQTKTGKNITSLAEVITYFFVLGIFTKRSFNCRSTI